MNLKLSITAKLTIVFVIFAALLVGVTGWLAYTSGRQALYRAVTSELFAVSLEKEAALNAWIEDHQQDIIALALSQSVIEDVANMVNPNSRQTQAAQERLTANLLPWVGRREFKQVLVLHAESGQVIAATDPVEVGKFKENRPYFIQGQQGPYVENLRYSLALRQPVMTASAPVHSLNGRLLAVLAGRLDMADLNSIIQRRTANHQTDDAFLVNASNLYVTQPRFIFDPAVLQRGDYTESVTACLAGQSGTASTTDYRGAPVITVYRWLPARGLCLVVKLDQAEALAPASTLGLTIAAISGVALLLATILAGWLARTITRPVLALQSGAARFAQGKLDVRLPETAQDELGQLAREFNRMAAAINQHQAQLQAYANELEARVEERTKTLQTSERRFRALIQNSLDVVALVDRQGNIVYESPSISKVLGYMPDESVGRNAFALVHPDDLPKASEVFKRLTQNPDEYVTTEVRMRHKDGSWRWMSATGANLLDEPAVQAFVANYRDITEQKRAEEAVKESEQRFRQVVESSPNAFVVVNQAGQIAMVNVQAETLFGYQRHQLIGQPVEILVPEAQQREHPTLRAEFLADPQARPMGKGRDLFARRKDGSLVPVEIGLSPIQTEDGLLILSAIVDITERKQAEETLKRTAEELRRSNTELEQFAYVASHDLQEPLRMVTSYLQLLERRYGNQLDGDAREFIDFAVDGAARMKTLINDLLAFSRLGTQGKAPAPTNCEPVLKRVLTTHKLAIEETEATITYGFLPMLMADEVQLEQLFQNLISNALKFRGNSSPQVHIEARRQNGMWLFSVRDNGIGIQPEFSERIFVIFQRLHGKAAYPGTGIGLAVCKKIVERHGGQIWVEPNNGEGVTFYFTLPALPH